MRQIERKRKKEREREREREREKERERDYVRKREREREKRYIEREIKKERFRESGPLSPTLSRIYACIRTFMRMSECVSNLFFQSNLARTLWCEAACGVVSIFASHCESS